MALYRLLASFGKPVYVIRACIVDVAICSHFSRHAVFFFFFSEYISHARDEDSQGGVCWYMTNESSSLLDAEKTPAHACMHALLSTCVETDSNRRGVSASRRCRLAAFRYDTTQKSSPLARRKTASHSQSNCAAYSKPPSRRKKKKGFW